MQVSVADARLPVRRTPSTVKVLPELSVGGISAARARLADDDQEFDLMNEDGADPRRHAQPVSLPIAIEGEQTKPRTGLELALSNGGVDSLTLPGGACGRTTFARRQARRHFPSPFTGGSQHGVVIIRMTAVAAELLGQRPSQRQTSSSPVPLAQT